MSKEDELKTIHEIIDMIRYYIQADGGDLEFLSYENDIVTLKITGNCVGCNIQDVTYKDGLLQILKLDLPNIKDVVLIEEKSDINALWDEFDQQQVRTSPFSSLPIINNNNNPISLVIDQQVKEIDLNNDNQTEIIDHTQDKVKVIKKKKEITKKDKTIKTNKASKKQPNKIKTTKKKVSKIKVKSKPGKLPKVTTRKRTNKNKKETE